MQPHHPFFQKQLTELGLHETSDSFEAKNGVRYVPQLLRATKYSSLFSVGAAISRTVPIRRISTAEADFLIEKEKLAPGEMGKQIILKRTDLLRLSAGARNQLSEHITIDRS